MASYKDIAPFIDTGRNRGSRIFGYTGLGIGTLLLLSCLQFYLDINQLIREKSLRKDGFDFISVTREITNENMGKDNRLTLANLQEIKSAPGVEDAAPLISNQFRAKVSAGNVIPFSTDIFLEAINNNFLDTLPPGFIWQEGQNDIPIILSSEFLEMYNIFAPTQGLPQISGESAASLNVQLECFSLTGVEGFRAHIVGLSDRINSVLVPENFLIWANKKFGQSENAPFSRIYIKTRDANNPTLLQFLDKKDYHVNKERTRFGRIKQVLQGIIAGLGLFAILVIALAILLFAFYLQLLISRSRDNLRLMVTLGYEPGWLGKQVSKRWVPAYGIIVLIALSGAQILHSIFRTSVHSGMDRMSFPISIYTFALGLIIFFVCAVINSYLLRKELRRL
ncbi:MAG: hypothetical protein KIS82_05835 [Ferruginibacter sp.]|nr:hypothetical protein [Ferruginibacter sp.]